MTGLLLVNKPSGMTSHDVVDKIRKVARIRRVGHTGTLDPNATGLLVLCLGRATRLSQHLTKLDKVYEGAMRLGIETDSYDLAGEIIAEKEVPELTVGEIQAVCDRFTGEIEQVPPMVSAVKIGGERLYKLARKGEVVDRPARPVVVREFRVLGYEAPEVTLRVACSSGTYVRGLCHDVGQVLGCGAVLTQLQRTVVGKHRLEDATSLEALSSPEDVERRLTPMGAALDLPEVRLGRGSYELLASGAQLEASDLGSPCPVSEGWVQIKDLAGELLALGTVQASAAGPRIQPRRVFLEQ